MVKVRFLRTILAIVFVTSITGASFYISRQISSSRSTSPNAPASKPQAMMTDGGDSGGSGGGGTTTTDKSEEDVEAIRAARRTRTGTPTPTALPRDQRDDVTPTTSVPPAPPSTPTTTIFRSGTANNTPTPTNSPTPTKIPTGEFGSDASAYMSEAEFAKDKCGDAQGPVAGTYCSGGRRFVVDLPDTKRAYLDYVYGPVDPNTNLRSGGVANTVEQTITNMSIDELLTSNGSSSNYNNCLTASCKQDVLNTAIKDLLAKNIILGTDQRALQSEIATNKVAQIVTTDPAKAQELLGTDTVAGLQNFGLTTQEATKVVQKSIVLSLYTDPSVTTDQLISKYCSAGAKPSTPTTICINDIRKSTDPRTEVLRLASIASTDIDSLKKSLQDNKDFQAKIQKNTDLYLSNQPNSVIAQSFCKDAVKKEACESSFIRESLIADIPKDTEYYKSIVQTKKDQEYLAVIANPQNSATDLAKIYCKGESFDCQRNFQFSDFVNQIKDQKTKDQALAARFFAMENLISQVIPKIKNGQSLAGTGIDVNTTNEIINLDANITHATWAYLKDKMSGTCDNIKNDATCWTKQSAQKEQEKLALEFQKNISKDFSIYQNYLGKYTNNKESYTDYEKAAAYKVGQDMNPIIIATSNQIAKTQTIPGLSKSGSAIDWKDVSSDYKYDAIVLACKNNVLTKRECASVTNSPSFSNDESKAAYAATIVNNLDSRMAELNNIKGIVQNVYNARVGIDVLPDVFHSNIASIDNFTVPADIRNRAIVEATLEIDPASRGVSIYSDSVKTKVFSTPPTDEVIKLANNKIDRALVTETYKIGGGVTATLATAGVATTACAALGPGGWIAAPLCGAVGGLAGALGNYIPVGEKTAAELAAQQQSVKDFSLFGWKPFNSDMASSMAIAMYSSQGAACDTGEGITLGRACTTKDNNFASYNAINQTFASVADSSLYSLQNNTDLQAQVALQPFINTQWELLQQENENQAKGNIVAGTIMGALSGGIGGKLAVANEAGNVSYLNALAKQQITDWTLWAPGSVVGTIQNATQFDATSGFVDTQAEIDLEKCIRELGIDKCNTFSNEVKAQTAEARKNSLVQGFVSDLLIQVGQTGFSYTNALVKNSINTNNNQANKTKVNPNDSTFISPELAQLLNAGDPRILNGSIGETDSITLQNIINAKTADTSANNSSNFLETVADLSNQTKVPTEDTSIVQAVVIYKDLQDVEFRVKLKEQGFSTSDVEVALKIRETNGDVPYTDSINERIKQNEQISAELRNDPNYPSDNLGAKVNEEVASDYSDFRNKLAEKIVADAKKAIAAAKPKPDTSTVIQKITGLTENDINQLTEFQRNDLDGIIKIINDPKTTPEEKIAFSEVLNWQANKYKNQNYISTTAEANNNSENLETTTISFKPGDDIYQAIPGDSNRIGKVPPSQNTDGEQVYYRISYLDENGKVIGTPEIHELTDTNNIPTDKPLLLEFGTKDSSQNFKSLKPSKNDGTQKLAMNIANEYNFKSLEGDSPIDTDNEIKKPVTFPTGAPTENLAKNRFSTKTDKPGTKYKIIIPDENDLFYDEFNIYIQKDNNGNFWVIDPENNTGTREVGTINRNDVSDQFFLVGSDDKIGQPIRNGRTQITINNSGSIYEIYVSPDGEITISKTHQLENVNGEDVFVADNNNTGQVKIAKSSPPKPKIPELPPIPPEIQIKGLLEMTPDQIIGVESNTYNQFEKSLNNTERLALAESISRISDTNLVVTNVDESGNVTYNQRGSSNAITEITIPENHPDTNIVNRAKEVGINVEGRSIREIKKLLNEYDIKIYQQNKSSFDITFAFYPDETFLTNSFTETKNNNATAIKVKNAINNILDLLASFSQEKTSKTPIDQKQQTLNRITASLPNEIATDNIPDSTINTIANNNIVVLRIDSDGNVILQDKTITGSGTDKAYIDTGIQSQKRESTIGKIVAAVQKESPSYNPIGKNLIDILSEINIRKQSSPSEKSGGKVKVRIISIEDIAAPVVRAGKFTSEQVMIIRAKVNGVIETIKIPKLGTDKITASYLYEISDTPASSLELIQRFYMEKYGLRLDGDVNPSGYSNRQLDLQRMVNKIKKPRKLMYEDLLLEFDAAKKQTTTPSTPDKPNPNPSPSNTKPKSVWDGVREWFNKTSTTKTSSAKTKVDVSNTKVYLVATVDLALGAAAIFFLKLGIVAQQNGVQATITPTPTSISATITAAPTNTSIAPTISLSPTPTVTVTLTPTTNQTQPESKYSGYVSPQMLSQLSGGQSLAASTEITNAFNQFVVDNPNYTAADFESFKLYIVNSNLLSPQTKGLINNNTKFFEALNEWFGKEFTTSNGTHSELVQCVAWGKAIVTLFPEFQQGSRNQVVVDRYPASDAKYYLSATTNKNLGMWSDTGNIFAANQSIISKYGDYNSAPTKSPDSNFFYYLGGDTVLKHVGTFDYINPGDTGIYQDQSFGPDDPGHAFTVLKKYIDSEGNKYLLITEANSPKKQLDGTPQTYFVSEKDFNDRVNPLSQTYFVADKNYSLETDTDPYSNLTNAGYDQLPDNIKNQLQ